MTNHTDLRHSTCATCAEKITRGEETLWEHDLLPTPGHKCYGRVPVPGPEQPQPLKVISLVYQEVDTAIASLAERYVVGIVVELPNGQWETRDLKTDDWVPLAKGRGITPRELARLQPYLVPTVNGKPLPDSNGWNSGPAVTE